MKTNHPVLRRNTRIISHWTALILCATALPVSAATHDYAQLMPADAAVFVNTQPYGSPLVKPNYPNFTQSIQSWFESMNDILEWRIVKEELVRMEWIHQSQEPEKTGLYQILFKREYGLGIYLPKLSQGEAVPILLYITEAEDPKALESLVVESLQSLKNYGIPVDTDSRYYEDVAINTIVVSNFRIPGTMISTACVNDLLLIGTGEGVLERALDLLAIGGESLSNQSFYQLAVQHLPEDRSLTTFIQNQPFVLLLDEIGQAALSAATQNKDATQTIAIQSEVLPILDAVNSRLNAVKGSAIAGRWTERGDETVCYTVFEGTLPHYPFGAMLTGDTVQFDLQRYVPRRTQAVFAGNLISFENVWQTVQSFLKDSGLEEKGLGKAIVDFQLNIGLSVEADILPWIGDFWATLQSSPSRDSILPVKQNAFFLTVKDRDAADRFLQRLPSIVQKWTGMAIMDRVASYHTVTYHTVSLPNLPIPIYQPTYGFIDDYLVLATSEGYFQELLDVREGMAPNITQGSKYQQLASVLTPPAKSISYNDIARSFDDLRENLERVKAVGGMAALFGNVQVNGNQPGMPPEVANWLDKAGIGLERLTKLMQILTVVQAEGTRVDVVDGGTLSTKVTTYLDLPRPTSVDINTRKPVSFFAQDYLLELANNARHELPEGIGDRVALYLYDLVIRYIPDQAEAAKAEIAGIEAEQAGATAPAPAGEVAPASDASPSVPAPEAPNEP